MRVARLAATWLVPALAVAAADVGTVPVRRDTGTTDAIKQWLRTGSAVASVH